MTRQFEMRGYHIIAHSGPIDACAQFIYKDFMISMSTMGLSKGACQSHVEIFHKDNPDKRFSETGFHTVEEAISYINSLETNFISNVSIHDVWSYAKQHAYKHSEGYQKHWFSYVAWWIDEYRKRG